MFFVIRNNFVVNTLSSFCLVVQEQYEAIQSQLRKGQVRLMRFKICFLARLKFSLQLLIHFMLSLLGEERC